MKRFRVLIVDDEVRILNFLVSKLKNTGYDVLTAHNGIEGLEQVKAQEPDLVVLDVLIVRPFLSSNSSSNLAASLMNSNFFLISLDSLFLSD